MSCSTTFYLILLRQGHSLNLSASATPLAPALVCWDFTMKHTPRHAWTFCMGTKIWSQVLLQCFDSMSGGFLTGVWMTERLLYHQKSHFNMMVTHKSFIPSPPWINYRQLSCWENVLSLIILAAHMTLVKCF